MQVAPGRLPLTLVSLLTSFALSSTVAQTPAAELVPAGDTTPAYALLLPATPATWLPVLLVWPERDGDAAALQAAHDLGAAANQAGFGVVAPALTNGTLTTPMASTLFANVRRRLHVAQGGLHGAARGALSQATQFVLEHRHQFQTFTALSTTDEADLAALRRLHARRIHVVTEGAALRAHFTALHAAREQTDVAADVARTLDDFHDAAANGDGARYFAILPDDAVFLGTDATERWTGAQFRTAFEKPYFQRREAWTYITLARHVRVAEGGVLAWFDETLDNASYGICRGSGVLTKRGDRWVLQHYDLSVPMPNDLAAAFARQIRAHGEGRPLPPARILLVRHAEKLDQSKDPPLDPRGRIRAQALAKALRDVPIDTVFHTEYQRTAQTVAPLCADKQLRAETVPATDVQALATRLRKLMPGQTALVCGHSNTIPELIGRLGGTGEKIADEVFDGLYLLTRGSDGVQVTTLRYGN